MISVIIPLYNKREWIECSLRSVLTQTFQDFEIIVVDDGSTDGSAEIVKGITDNRIRLISQKNSGVSAARNRGIAESRGELIALLDGDDEWKPEYLETQFNLSLRYPECRVFAVNYETCDSNKKITPTIINALPFAGEDGELTNYFEVASCSHPPICSISIMVRKGVFEQIGGFPIGVRSGEDLLTWARLACLNRIAYSRKSLARFNVEGYDIKEKPKRIPSEDDFVGHELAKLEKDFNPRGIRLYRAHWHKMRASIYMRLRMRRCSIKESIKGLALNPCNIKLYAFIALNLIPSRFQPF